MTDKLHIMLDLETWGKRPGFDLRSIGACVFVPTTGFVHDGSLGTIRPFYIATDNPPVPSLIGRLSGPIGYDDGNGERRVYGLRRDPDTVQWWSEQSDEAQAAFTDPVDLRDALIMFGGWLRALSNEQYDSNDHDRRIPDDICLWSHGPAFDPPILAEAYHAVGLPLPWHYRAPRDTRTAFDMAGVGDDHSAWMQQFNTGTAHNALDDALAQAKCVNGAYKRAGLAIRTVEITDPSTMTPIENMIRDATLEHGAKICEGVTSWGLSPTKLEVAESTQAFCAKAIRAQMSDSPQRKAHEAKQAE